MKNNGLGKVYNPGEIIVRQGEEGDCMYVIQDGQLEVLLEKEGKEMRVAILKSGDFFGEMAIFQREKRSATIKSLEESRVLTIDKKGFFRRIHQDPSLVFRIMETMSQRIRELNDKLTQSKESIE